MLGDGEMHADAMQLGIFLAAMIALVVCGCIVTRHRKRSFNTGPVEE
jgi:hypothetical protein